MTEPANNATASAPGGNGLIGPLVSLAQDLRSRNWPAALTDLISLLQAVAGNPAGPLAAVPPHQLQATPPRTADQAAAALDEVARELQAARAGAAAAPAQAQLVNWGNLLPLIVQVLQIVLAHG
jgi:hypothetical protein